MTLENAALVVIDVQNDFCPGGALEVPDGEAVVAVINAIAPRFPARILTPGLASARPSLVRIEPRGEDAVRDHHPRLRRAGAVARPLRPGHGRGRLPPGSGDRRRDLVLRKGFRRGIDSYSAFYENDRGTPTGLAGYLRSRGISRLFFAGLATDFCVAWSAIDGAREGFESAVVENACRGIDLEGSLDAAWAQMAEAGVARIRSPAL